MRLQQLKLYETLLGGSAERARQLLSHQPFLRPLLDLLNQFAAAKTESKFDIKGIFVLVRDPLSDPNQIHSLKYNWLFEMYIFQTWILVNPILLFIIPKIMWLIEQNTVNLDYEQTTIILGKILTLSIICLLRIVGILVG